MQQALFQQQDARRLLEAHQAGGADGGWVDLTQLLMLAAHVLTTQPESINSTYRISALKFKVLSFTLIIKLSTTEAFLILKYFLWVIPEHML